MATETSVRSTTTAKEADEILEDEALAEEKLLEDLEREELPSHIREARLSELKDQMQQFQNLKEKDYGKYSEILKEKDILEVTTNERHVILHFYHQDFRRCAIVDKHLQSLSQKHFQTKFCKVDAEKALFFVKKLKVQVLPTVICFRDGIVIDRLIGFEELGNTDSFSTEQFERRLAKSGVIQLGDVQPEENKSIFGFARRSKTEDSSDEEDY
ncbi:phosducin-like protein 3 [Anneissia japonica]|uniref:phosducin-like protein 3 n=1 Tax=Anneissia japonica TaxID=1529436 RepID=UPI001425A2FA|nr:phosducin-like protein 3 [Anneissia japonica]